VSIEQVELWFFLPVMLFLYWIGSGRRVWQNAVLLLGGWFFYWTWNPTLVWVVVLATAVDYGLGRFMGTEGRPESQRKAALALSVVYNLVR
jgi:D-alanyl-lipoteichoic acid acyltransferase DltB (MBOAT superfamily)